MFVLARTSVWAAAGSEFEFPELEVLLEFAPFVVGWFPIFGLRADGPAGV